MPSARFSLIDTEYKVNKIVFFFRVQAPGPWLGSAEARKIVYRKVTKIREDQSRHS